MECVVEWSMDVRLSLKYLNEKQREFPAPPWAGVKLVRSAASHFFNYRDALLQFGTHVIGLAKPAHPFWGKTRCAGSVSRPCEGADAHGHARHGSNRRPLLRWHFCCVRVLLVPRESRQGRARAELKFATGRFAGFPPETTAKPRATVPVVLHSSHSVIISTNINRFTDVSIDRNQFYLFH